MWDSLGFRESPYNTNPLKVRAEDVELLVGRDAESVSFCTQIESSEKGILILSGPPGVGKTSFFNIQQFLLETGQSGFGRRLLSARVLCPVQPGDDSSILALRALDSFYRSICAYCTSNEISVPSETQKIGKWIKGTGNNGFSVGLELFGFGGNLGRNVELPSLSDATFETLVDAISVMNSEIISKLNFQGSFIVFDNLENLEDEDLKSILITFRDTLFSIDNIWWVLIGQSGLGTLIQTLDPRVFERISGSGLEIPPIKLDELDQAICLRVTRFHSDGNDIAPLPKSVHEELFNASYGEMRFVFKYGNSICVKFVERTRMIVMSELKSQGVRISPESLKPLVDKAIAKTLVNNNIPHGVAMGHLREIVETELSGLFLKAKEKEVLLKIGEKIKTRPSEYADFSVKTLQDFSQNYLIKMWRQHLLVREQEGRYVNYRLRGIAIMAHTFGLLS